MLSQASVTSTGAGRRAERVKTLHAAITIAARREAVWHVLLDDAMFRRWSASFAEGSYSEGDWRQGGTIRFLTPEATAC